MLSPKKPIAVNYDEIVSVLKKHYQPQINIIYERFKFNTRKQEPNESNSDYVAALRSLASNCEFGAKLAEYLRDRLVAGIYDEATQRVLLATKDLTFDSAIEIAFAREAAAKDSSAMHSSKAESSNTHQITKEKKPNYNNRTNKFYAHKPAPKSSSNKRKQFPAQKPKNANVPNSDLPKSLCKGCGERH